MENSAAISAASTPQVRLVGRAQAVLHRAGNTKTRGQDGAVFVFEKLAQDRIQSRIRRTVKTLVALHREGVRDDAENREVAFGAANVAGQNDVGFVRHVDSARETNGSPGGKNLSDLSIDNGARRGRSSR